MNKKRKRENKMYFISDTEYIYFPFSVNNYQYNNTNKIQNQLKRLKCYEKEVIHNE